MGRTHAQICFAHRKFTTHPQAGDGNIHHMGLLKASGGRLQRGSSATALSTYQVGQRTVQLFELADGHIQWVCNCEDYAASAGSAQGPWCKHVAKASAIRSIERLTGARVVGRGRAAAREATQATDSSHADAAQPLQSAVQPH
jgi:hypothetical protein